MTCIVIMTAVFSAATPFYSIHPLNRVCGLDWPELPVLIMLGIALVVICPILLAQVWGLNDAFGIKYDLIMCVTLAVFDMVLAMVWEVKLKRIRLIFSGLFFAWLSVICVHITSVVVPLVRSRKLARRLHSSWPESSFESALAAPYWRPAAAGLTHARGFIDMLENPIQYEEFRRFTAQSFCSELTSFIDDYQLIKAYTVRAFGTTSKADTIPDKPQAVDISEDTEEEEESVLGRLFGRRNHHISVSQPIKNTVLHTSVIHGIYDTVVAQCPQKHIRKSTAVPKHRGQARQRIHRRVRSSRRWHGSQSAGSACGRGFARPREPAI
ncbi:hypothetical protein DL89DRAFT_86487 [Linderina pennispora]|uniref:RGS domain-containing protein n=1 Tax=Linderina pennispora TaxID=61395 RepID=A0A1Y1WIW1_9FUNG|nr:uncharacterized protein DL89DRAFT_86487 [Linderina pennispora]ORX73034.1 hypothetical protein DL89DRAFT_86487 [Linderina pennispora]